MQGDNRTVCHIFYKIETSIKSPHFHTLTLFSMKNPIELRYSLHDIWNTSFKIRVILFKVKIQARRDPKFQTRLRPCGHLQVEIPFLIIFTDQDCLQAGLPSLSCDFVRETKKVDERMLRSLWTFQAVSNVGWNLRSHAAISSSNVLVFYFSFSYCFPSNFHTRCSAVVPFFAFLFIRVYLFIYFSTVIAQILRHLD